MAEAGLASRRGAEALILAGKVRVNGLRVAEPGAKAVPGVDEITVNGKILGEKEKTLHYMFHKPEGYLTALKDEKLKRPTISVFLKDIPVRVYPVGRLDKDVSGFLVLTNDGELAARLMHPRSLVPKVYRARVAGVPDGRDLRLLSSGTLIIGGKNAAPAKAGIVPDGEDEGMVELILTEGRHGQVKKMLKAVGHPVIELKRVAYCGVPLDPALPRGAYRELRAWELEKLTDKVGTGRTGRT
jgi:pseudouridine synthase